MVKRKHFLYTKIQHKVVKMTWKQKFLRLFSFLFIFIILEISYNFANDNTKKENLIDLRFNYVIMNDELKDSLKTLQNLQINSCLSIIKYRSLITMMIEINEKNRKMEHLPLMRPVNEEIKEGDGIKFRGIHPILGIPIWHLGQDFPAPVGTEVYAAGTGIIQYIGRDTINFGNYIVINHGYGYETIYGHLSKFEVEECDSVKQGDLIGLVGSTGRSTGPHLHYQINLYGKYQNPLDFYSKFLTKF
jgi:hypothetical protein